MRVNQMLRICGKFFQEFQLVCECVGVCVCVCVCVRADCMPSCYVIKPTSVIRSLLLLLPVPFLLFLFPVRISLSLPRLF